MKTRVVKGKEYRVYEDREEFLLDEDFVYWKDVEDEKWVETDDGQIAEVIETGFVGKNKWIRTPISISPVSGGRMEGEFKTNLYSFSGEHTEDLIKKREKPTEREKIFGRLIAYTDASDEAITEAYRKAFSSVAKEDYVQKRARLLFNQERVQTVVREEIKKIMDVAGVTDEWIVEKSKDIVESKESNFADKTNNLKLLAKIRGLLDTQKQSMTLELSGAITPERLKEIQNKALPE